MDRRGIDGISGKGGNWGEREGGDWEHNGERGGHREERERGAVW